MLVSAALPRGIAIFMIHRDSPMRILFAALQQYIPMPIDCDFISVGDAIPVFVIRPTLRHAVMYAAAMWEFQRIHYDDRYAREEEGLPGAVVQGPVLGNYLAQAIAAWTGPEGVLKRLEWRNHGLVAFGDDIRCQGAVVCARTDANSAGVQCVQVDCTLEMLNQRNEKVLSATATVEIQAATGNQRDSGGG